MLCTIVVLFISINRRFPQSNRVIYSCGETGVWNETLAITVKGREWLDSEEVNKRYGDCENQIKGADHCTVLVEMSFKNIGDSKELVQPYHLYLECLGWCNGVSREVYFCCNDDEFEFELKPKEEKTILLPYTIFSVDYKDKEWDSVKEKDYSISILQYPTKACWKIS